jgi:hypothetical protein
LSLSRTAAGLLVASGLLCGNAARGDGPHAAAGAPASALETRRLGLLHRAEAALRSGEAGPAVALLERAALMAHAPDTETALVRAYLQGGEYRRALAFAAHAAGAHREAPGAGVLYAWLLALGGQNAIAAQQFGELQRLHPTNAAVRQAARAVAAGAPWATGVLLKAPARLAPYGPVPGLAHAARVAASATLLPGGAWAAAPLGALPTGTKAVWVRNGLGQSSRARVERRMAAAGVALLRLYPPLTAPEGVALAGRDPFAGAIGYAIEFAPGPSAAPAWPLLAAGFFGARGGSAAPALQGLGIALPLGRHGGPVFDASGQLAGIALAPPRPPERQGAGGTGDALLLPASGLRMLLRTAALPPSVAGGGLSAPARPAMDLVYENSLRMALQLLTAPPDRPSGR